MGRAVRAPGANEFLSTGGHLIMADGTGLCGLATERLPDASWLKLKVLCQTPSFSLPLSPLWSLLKTFPFFPERRAVAGPLLTAAKGALVEWEAADSQLLVFLQEGKRQGWWELAWAPCSAMGGGICAVLRAAGDHKA